MKDGDSPDWRKREARRVKARWASKVSGRWDKNRNGRRERSRTQETRERWETKHQGTQKGGRRS